MLTDEDNLDHAVAYLWVPFLSELLLASQQLVQLVFLHSGAPLSSLLHSLLLTCLLEDIAHVLLVGEVADTLGTHDITRPFSSDKLVKQSEVEWLAAVIDEGSDTIFLCLAFLMVVIMMVVVMMVMFVVVVIVVVMMMLVLIVLLIVIVVIVVVMLFLFFLLAVALSFDFLNPSC